MPLTTRPFGDHLRYHLFWLHGKEDLIQGLRQVIRHHACQDELVFFRLRGAGLVCAEKGAVLPRCQLYTDFSGSASMAKQSIYTVGGTAGRWWPVYPPKSR
jgi:hypothetical protein